MAVPAPCMEDNLLLKIIIQDTETKFSISINEYAIIDRIKKWNSENELNICYLGTVNGNPPGHK